MKRLICAAAMVLFAVSISACAAKPKQTPATVVATVTTRTTATTAHGPDIYDIEQSIDQGHLDSLGARVLSKELMLYGDFLAEYSPDSRDHTIDDDQRVWVVRVFFPEFDTIRGGVFTNATTTSLYDAETGFYYGYSVSGDEVFD